MSAIEYVNQDGEVRFQPEREDGKRLWKGEWPAGVAWLRQFDARADREYVHPRLYRSRRRAERIAERASNRWRRRTWEEQS